MPCPLLAPDHLAFCGCFSCPIDDSGVASMHKVWCKNTILLHPLSVKFPRPGSASRFRDGCNRTGQGPSRAEPLLELLYLSFPLYIIYKSSALLLLCFHHYSVSHHHVVSQYTTVVTTPRESSSTHCCWIRFIVMENLCRFDSMATVLSPFDRPRSQRWKRNIRSNQHHSCKKKCLTRT